MQESVVKMFGDYRESAGCASYSPCLANRKAKSPCLFEVAGNVNERQLEGMWWLVLMY